MEKKFVAKIEVELDEDMIANLAIMGGYLGHSIAIERAAEDIQSILRDCTLGIPVIGGKMRVGVTQDESKKAWIEFQRSSSATCVDLALVDTEFDNDDFAIFTYGDPYKDEYTDRTDVTKESLIDAIDGSWATPSAS